MNDAPHTVAIMQPYFMPYAGYFRLFAQSDLFVIYDCVQFPRRGWVHRNKLVDAVGNEDWLTLPLVKAPQSVLIQDLAFPPDAAQVMAERLRAFPLETYDPALKARVMDLLLDMNGSVTDYIVATMRFVNQHLNLPWNVVRSSSLGVPESFRGQDRIIEIARRVGARRYINPPGGLELYDAPSFAAAGMELDFLPPYPGPFTSILARMLAETPEALADDITAG